MRFSLGFIGFIMVLAISTNNVQASKVTWGADGKPHIESSGGDLKGCFSGGVNSIGEDNNTKDVIKCQ